MAGAGNTLHATLCGEEIVALNIKKINTQSQKKNMVEIGKGGLK